MIKKLQRRFVLITMISVVIVLGTIITAINISNFVNVRKDVDKVIDTLSANDGKFPAPDVGEHFDRPFGDKRREPMNAETPYETRYFTAFVTKDGEVSKLNTGHVAAINRAQATEYVNEVVSKNKERGYVDNYRYYVKENEQGYLVICVDCNRQLSTAKNFLMASIMVSVVGTLMILLLVILFSQRALKPIIESYEKQKRFITDASHELKTPLTVISANTEIIEMSTGENEWTESIKKQVSRLTSLTKNLTRLSKMDEEGMIIQREMFDMSEAVEDVIANFSVLADSKKLTITNDVQKNIMYYGEEKSIRQLLSILFDNAVKYSDGKIEVSLKKQKNKVHFRIYNTTAEVEVGNKNVYFERFYRGDESRSTKIEGFGIGLSIAKSIVELHKGRINAKSDDGKSLEINVYF